MSEKKGHLVKMYYDFDTAGVLEIFLNNKTWYRVTSREFRSFDGKRRIPNLLNLKVKEKYTTYLWLLQSIMDLYLCGVLITITLIKALVLL